MASWKSQATERARNHVAGLLSIAASKVRPAIEAREGITPFALALGLDEEVALLVAREEGAGTLSDLLASRAQHLWAGIVLVDPGDKPGIPALTFVGAHREAPPFKAVIPWSRATNGKVVWGAADIMPGSLRIFD